MKNYYEILGVDKNSDIKTIKKAYRELVKKFHPDVNNGNKNTKIFEEINNAYKVLIDPEKRKNYDYYLINNQNKEKIFFNFIEFSKNLLSINFIKSLFFNKKMNLTNNNYKDISIDELLRNVIYSSNKYVQIHAVKELFKKNDGKILYDLFRLLYSNINEDVKLVIIEGLVKINNHKVKKYLMDVYNIEKSIRLKIILKKYLNI